MNKIILILFLFCGLLHIAIAQDDATYEFTYEVNRVYKPLAVSAQTIDTAEVVDHLNPFYKSSWVKEYISVDITTTHNGKEKLVSTKDAMLSPAQLDNMKQIDLGSEISIVIKYIPDNNLTQNDIQEERFNITVDPPKEASFRGGEQKLSQYIQDKVLSDISENEVEIHNVKAVQFTVNEEGHVVDVHIPEVMTMYNLRGDQQWEAVLSKSICDMPTWIPAEYKDGSKVSQDFVLTIGDHRSCTLNLLNVRRDKQFE